MHVHTDWFTLAGAVWDGSVGDEDVACGDLLALAIADYRIDVTPAIYRRAPGDEGDRGPLQAEHCCFTRTKASRPAALLNNVHRTNTAIDLDQHTHVTAATSTSRKRHSDHNTHRHLQTRVLPDLPAQQGVDMAAGVSQQKHTLMHCWMPINQGLRGAPGWSTIWPDSRLKQLLSTSH